ncbi:MAG TPA: hypothetical protein VF002_03860 [Gaiellaceae bacterium]
MIASLRRPSPEFLQWFGLLGAALTWTVQLVVGFGVTVARCGAANGVLGVDVKVWEIGLMAGALALALLAETAAVTLFLRTREVDESAPPPAGRHHFFAVAATLGNLLFLMIILLSGIGALLHMSCQQA